MKKNSKENGFGERLSKNVESAYLYFPFGERVGKSIGSFALNAWDVLNYKVFGKPKTGQEGALGEQVTVKSVSVVSGERLYMANYEGEAWKLVCADHLDVGDVAEVYDTQGLVLYARKLIGSN